MTKDTGKYEDTMQQQGNPVDESDQDHAKKQHNARFDGVLFDLDGTLIDTAPDLVGALNTLLHEENHPPAEYERVSRVVSDGSIAMLNAALSNTVSEDKKLIYRERLLELYASRIAQHSTLYPGMSQVLDILEQRDISWGIVTNKPAHLTQALLHAMNLDHRAATIVSGDTLARAKPWPDPVLHACQQARLDVERTIIIGDSIRDIQAGQAAGTATMAVTYGYIAADDNPINWDADYCIDRACQIIDIL